MADDNLIHPDDREGNRVPEEKKNQAPNQPDSKPQCAETPIPGIPPKPNFPPPERHQCKKRYKCIKEEIKYWFEVAAIIGGLVGLYLIWLQYSDMTRATDASVKQSKALIAQSEIMQGQLDEMKTTRELDERAWIFAEVHDNALIADGTNFVFYAFAKSSGKTPAIITGDVIKATFYRDKIPQFDGEVVGEEIMLVPNETLKLPLIVAPTLVAMSKDIPFYFYGTIFYKDISGNKHWTQFCYSLTEMGAKTARMPFHSSCDDVGKAKGK